MTIWFRKKDSTNTPNGQSPAAYEPEQETIDEQDTTPQKQPRRILCAHCRHPLTHSNEICSIQGDSEHRCLNPSGIYFHIQCFLTAPGCMCLGPTTAEYSWFSGYHWQMTYCAQCQCHLGWHYDGHTPNFFGLIKDRLVVEKDTPDAG